MVIFQGVVGMGCLFANLLYVLGIVVFPTVSKIFSKMSSNSKIAILRNISEKMPNGPHLAILQHHVVELKSNQRSSLDSAVAVPPPYMYDVVILDITPEDLSRIAYELQSEPLAETSVSSIFPVQGILYGPNHRMFVPPGCFKASKSHQCEF